MSKRKVKVLKEWSNGPKIHVVGSTVDVTVYDPAAKGEAAHIEDLSVKEFDALVASKHVQEVVADGAVAVADKAAKK